LNSLNFSVTSPAPTPEPGTWMLLATGVGALIMMRRRFCC